MHFQTGLKNAFLPYSPFGAARSLLAVQIVIAALLWSFSNTKVLPGPQEIAHAWLQMQAQQNLLIELWASIQVLLLSLLLSTGLALLIATASTAPVFLPLARFAAILRFLGFAGLSYLFMLMTGDAYELKLALLTFGTTVMMVTALMAEVQSIPQQAIDHCKTLGMRNWRITYELVVLGKAAALLDLVRQNAAIGWTLLTMVEGLARSQGGIGALLLNQNRYFQLSAVFAIQITILAYGLGQDYLLGKLRDILCPYTRLDKNENT